MCYGYFCWHVFVFFSLAMPYNVYGSSPTESIQKYNRSVLFKKEKLKQTTNHSREGNPKSVNLPKSKENFEWNPGLPQTTTTPWLIRPRWERGIVRRQLQEDLSWTMRSDLLQDYVHPSNNPLQFRFETSLVFSCLSVLMPSCKGTPCCVISAAFP